MYKILTKIDLASLLLLTSSGIRFHSFRAREVVRYTLVIDPSSPYTFLSMNVLLTRQTMSYEEGLKDARLFISNIRQLSRSYGPWRFYIL